MSESGREDEMDVVSTRLAALREDADRLVEKLDDACARVGNVAARMDSVLGMLDDEGGRDGNG